MDQTGKTSTRRGRIVYNRPVHLFTTKDAARVLRHALAIDPDKPLPDYKLNAIFDFLIRNHFLPTELEFQNIKWEPPDIVYVLRDIGGILQGVLEKLDVKIPYTQIIDGAIEIAQDYVGARPALVGRVARILKDTYDDVKTHHYVPIQ